MSSYALTIQFANQDAQQINAVGQKVTIVKEVGGSSGAQTTWVAFKPFENNAVNWESQYGIYASATEIQAGATISKLSTVNPAQSAMFYPFENGAFSNPETGAGKNNYGSINRYGSKLTFGLAQSVTANGNKFDANPMNAVQVLNGQNVTFTPIEKIKVFLSGNFDNGVVLSSVAGTALTVDLTRNSSQTIHYNNSAGTFVTGPLS